MIELETNDNGVILPVKAQPGASRDGIRGWQEGVLRVAITQIAERGKANQALRAILAKGLSLRKSQLELLRGATSRQKLFLITGIPKRLLMDRLEKAISTQ